MPAQVHRLALLALLLALPQIASAATFNVTRLDDPVPGPCTASDCSLREAVLAANDPGGDDTNTINLPPGTYVLTQNGSNENGGVTGDLDVLDHILTINGASAATTSIDASGLTNGAVGDRIFDVPVADVGLILNNLTLKNGNPAFSASPDGGAVLVDGASEVTINQCNLTGNQAQNGGALFADNGGTLVLSQTTLSNNRAMNIASAGYGGGIGIVDSDAFLENSTISGNQAAINGGGIATEGGNLVIRSSTITDNTADDQGGGIHVFGGTGDIANSILAGNSDSDASSDCGTDTGAFDSLGFNVFGQVGGCTAPLSTDKNDVTDLGLLPLANYGGPTLTHQLESDSPAIGKGNPAGCDGPSGNPLTTDQRGQVRDAGGTCDSGAVELGTSDLSVTKSSDPEAISDGATLNYLVTVLNNGPDVNFNVALTDTLPGDIIFNSVTTDDDTDVCSQSAGVVSCELGQLDSGASATVTISVTVALNIDGSLTNTASVEGTEIDPNPDNDSFTLNTPVSGGGGCALGSGTSAGTLGAWGVLALVTGGIFLRRRSVARA